MPDHADQSIIRLVEEYMHSSEHPDLVQYRQQTYERDFLNRERFIWSLKHIAALGRYEDKKILDVGCGFGWQAFVMSLLDGRNKITAMDILPSMIDGMSECVEKMRVKGVALNLEPVCGDICAPGLKAQSFDSIYSLEAIEHVHDIPKMLESCASLLKPGGSLILVNDQNALNTAVRTETIEMWEKREHSWEWARQLETWRPIEHKNAKPFAVMREEIVRAANPGLDDSAVKTVVAATAGLLKHQIEDFAKQYRPGVSLPEVHEFDRCRNPVTGEYAERLFDPFALAGLMKEAGFRTRVRHHFRKFPLNLLNGIQFRAANLMLFNIRPVFIVMGIKQ